MEVIHYIFETELGWVGVSSSAAGLCYLCLPQSSFDKACQRLGINIEPAKQIPPDLIDVIGRLKRYFGGYKVAFFDELDLSGTEFQCQVWEATRKIPYGETRSYGWVAEHIGKPGAVRAVGHALGQNPLPIIIPCHRVLRRDGGLGGYTGGLEMKRYLLWLEASAFMRDRVD